MSATQLRPLPPKLPETAEEYFEDRQGPERTLNDLVEDVTRALILDPAQATQYKAYIYAVWDEQAVEGSLAMDNAKVAEMIRAKAKDMGVDEVATAKLATINKAHSVVQRRYKKSRKQRRNMIGGQEVPGENGGE